MRIKVKRKKLYDIKRDGITQSLLSLFLECRQKARYYLDGWESPYYSQPLTDGTIGHGILEFAYNDIIKRKFKVNPNLKDIRKYSNQVEKLWYKEHPRPSQQGLECLEYSLALSEALLPIYFDYYKKDLKKIKWLSLEEKFKVPITLSDGRKTFVCGKKDGEFKSGGLWLFETKFKALINEGNLIDTLGYETQVFLYMWSKYKQTKIVPEGVLYNIIRRTSLRLKKGESLQKFAKRVGKDAESRPDFYFIRIPIDIEKRDLMNFEEEVLGLLKDFYDWIEGKVPHYKNTYSCINKYGRCKFIPACSKNEFDNLNKRKILFQELATY